MPAIVKEVYTARSFPFTQILHSHTDVNILRNILQLIRFKPILTKDAYHLPELAAETS